MTLTPNQIERSARDQAIRAQFASKGIPVERAVEKEDMHEKHVLTRPPRGAPEPRRQRVNLAPRLVDRERINIDPLRPPSPFIRISGIFVARKNHFAVEIGFDALSIDVMDLAFEHLPLAENGWNRATATAHIIGFHRWRISRT